VGTVTWLDRNWSDSHIANLEETQTTTHTSTKPDSEKPSREKTEASVLAQLIPGLAQHLAIVEECEGLAYEYMAVLKKPRQPVEVVRVHTSLLARVIEDLRVCVLTATRGYTMQAWSVAASCFEAAYSLGHIGTDVERAKRWLEHMNLDTVPWSVYDSVMGTAKFLKFTDPVRRDKLVKVEYTFYQRLCMGKHVNPVTERERRWKLAPGTATLVLYPFYSSAILGQARLGLNVAIHAATMAILSFHQAHLSEDADPRPLDLLERSRALVESPDQPTGETGSPE
jgi:hypothetical protein